MTIKLKIYYYKRCFETKHIKDPMYANMFNPSI